MKKYTKGNITIYCADNMQMMRDMKDNEFDLAIVDPPYGIGDFEPNNNSKCAYKCDKKYSIKWNDETPEKKYFIELTRVSKNRIIWGANYYNCFDTGGTIIWDKGNTHPNMSKCEVASNSLNRIVDKFEYLWHGMRQQNMKDKENRIHPCQKPVALYKWLLLNYAKKGDRILDTHGGSFSSAIACWQLNFEYVGIEIDEEYFDNGVKRLKEFNQPVLPGVFSI